MIKCPNCGNDAPESARSCVVCATPLPRPSVATAVLTPPVASRGATTSDSETVAAPFVNPFTTGGAATSLVPGQTFGQRYQIISLLGVGGMGAVYHVWDSELALSLALKVIKPDPDPVATQELERRFKRELVLARQVTHTNVIRIHDLGEIDGIKYITMPFVHGTDLARLLSSEGKLPVARALPLARQVVSGLRAAHEAGIVHRDLKPANILIDDSEKAVITDFGIARSTEAGTFATAAGAIIGTLAYMAPEQATGKSVDQRADMYAFGLIVSEMLVGKRTSSGGDTALALLIERASHAPPRLRALDPSIPEGLDKVVARCVEPDPAARFQTTAELEAALDRLDATGNEKVAAVVPAIAIKARSQWLPVAVAIVLGLAIGLGSWLYLTPGTPGPTSAPATPAPVSVLIADFDNQANDAVFTGALEQALNIGIEGASFITSYSRATAQQIAQRLNPGALLNENSARLVAEREGIDFVLTGAIAASGSGYQLAVKALDPASGSVRANISQTVSGKADVLQGITTVASRLRDALGDTTPESARRANQETVTARSLEALHSYSLAQDLSSTGRWVESIEHYQAAIKSDPNFGRAYSGWGTSLHNLGRRDESKTVWDKALPLMDSMTDREKYRTLGAYFLGPGQSYKEAIDNFTKLVQTYPYDRAGEHNLAVAYFQALDIPQAIVHGRKAVEIYPRDTRARNNLALYLMYAGNFKAAADEANAVLKENPSQYKAYLSLAASAFSSGDMAATREAYNRMAKVGAAGASLSAYGLADLSMYVGRFADAAQTLQSGIAEDEKSNNRVARAIKLVALAEVRLAEGQPGQAQAAIKDALAIREDATLVPAAFVLSKAGRTGEARAIADELAKQFQPRSRAYGAIVQAEIFRTSGRLVEGVDSLVAAQKHADLWLGRFVLGVINVEAGRYAAALGELNQCVKRQGEATAVFFDDVPSFRYLAPLKYWLGRAQEGLSNPSAAADEYRAFLALRSADSREPMVVDARKRLAAFGTPAAR